MVVATAIVVATTPTFQLILPDEVDTSIIEHLKFSLVQGSTEVVKDLDSSAIDGQIVSVYLDQNDTLQLEEGNAEFQLNWTYAGGSRDCSRIVKIRVLKNLYAEVIE